MDLSAEMKAALNQNYNWRMTNVPELDTPVLIVLDYSPSRDQSPLCIALDTIDGPKFWMTASKVVKIDNQAPRLHMDYRQFRFEGRLYHPYSIVSLPHDIFDNIRELSATCRRIYEHVDWS